MLLGSDDVAWGRLEHAYGSAEDVPDLVRAAASADVDTAGEGSVSCTAAEGDPGGSVQTVLDERVEQLLELLGDDDDEQVRGMVAVTLGTHAGCAAAPVAVGR